MCDMIVIASLSAVRTTGYT